ncbi:MAG: hypothetical protein IPM29_08085 [Planctomycetes bacterium]|nr:hypothetical protein [Planctomycetota bacterium]
MRSPRQLVIGSFAVFALTVLCAYGSGVFPGSSGMSSAAAQSSPSCTSCHSGTIGAQNTTTRLDLGQLSLAAGETVPVTLQVSGGPSGTRGGFAAENTGGAFVAGTGTRINTSGRAGQYAAHSNNSSRSWSFQYTAPATAGDYRVYAVGMASSGSSSNGDVIAFNGSVGTATQGTPVYVGVNAAGNTRYGSGCVGSYGVYPVLFSDTVPSIGNASYRMRLIGAPPTTSAIVLLGAPRLAPLDLGIIGITGCSMWVDSLSTLPVATGAGNAQRGEGTANVPFPIPNDASLRGVGFAVQAAIVDAANGRALPITVTNGLIVQLQ